MPKKPIRRFLKLDTNEVSLVDVPANEVSFLVTKNQELENEDMSAQAGNQNTDESRVELQVDGGDSAVEKAIQHMNSIVENIVKVATEKNQGEKEGSEDSQSVDSGDTQDVSKATVKTILSALGMKGDDMKKACDKLKAAGFNPDQKFPSAQPPVKKDASGEDSDEGEADTKKSDTDPIVEDQPLTMQGLVDAVSKAAAFTPGRIKQLQDAQDILKLVLEAVAPNATPKTKVPGVESHSNPSAVSDLSQPKKKPVMKSADGNNELVSTLKSLADGVNNLKERVESIEKTRKASNSVEEDGDTDTNTQKNQGLWNGLL